MNRIFIITVLLLTIIPLMSFSKSGIVITAVPEDVSFAGKISIQSLIGSVSNDSINFSLYLPPEYETLTKNIPMAIWLHGLGGSYRNYGKIIRNYELAYEKGLIGPMIIMFPDGYKNAMWADSKSGKKQAETNVIKEILPYLENNYKLIPNRNSRIIMGFSMGGFGAFEYATKFPEIFSVAVSFDGAMHNWESLNSRPTIANEIFENDSIYWSQYSPYQNIVKNADSIRSSVKFLAYVGQLVEYNNRYKNIMDNLNIKVDYKITPCKHNLKCLFDEAGDELFIYIKNNIVFYN